MPTILAIETSSDFVSAALLQGDSIIAREVTGIAGAQTHSQTILPLVQALLAEAGVQLAQCDAIAFGAGPGSFTGVRTACGVVQGLAFGAQIPAVPVITLHAMAQACREATGASGFLTILDARMGEVYWAQYCYADGWQTVAAPTLSAPGEVAAIGDAIADVIVCGNGLTEYASVFAGKDFAAHGRPEIVPHAAQIATLGRIEFLQGRGVAARDAQPLYLRNKVALTTIERMAKVGT
jgi:tRNA threonylcarbamoyladenosine biosynthesis protein TsaB